jgi:hypothetical protein
MASQSQPITTTDVLNYAGALFYVGATFGKAPTLSYKGLTTGFKTATGSNFPMVNYIAGDSGAQDGQTEDDSIAAMTNSSYTPTQTTQYMQQFRYTYVQSYASKAMQGTLSGVAVTGMGVAAAATIPAQRLAHMKQLMADFEYSALKGTAQAWTNAATAGAMGGVVTAIESGSETAAAGAALSKTLINTEIARMYAAGCEFGDMVITANAHQIQQLNELYGNAIQSVTVGGFNLQTVNLPIAGPVKILPNAEVATDDLVFLDMNHYTPVFAVVPGKPVVVVEPIAQLGAGEYEQLFTIASIDYGDVLFHGMVSGLATS